MTPEALNSFIAVFPDPMLILSTEGVVLTTNPAARRLFGHGASPVGQPLAQLVHDPPAKVDRLVAMWQRTPTLTVGALTWRGPGQRAIPCRADGARLGADSPEGAPRLLVRCRVKGEEETTSRFLVLNERLAALGREIVERKRVEVELREQQEWLRVTLASIGDAVVATDRDGRVAFMNPVAEQLTGWTRLEATGKPFGDLMRLVNEDTREPAEHPIARVLRDGRVVGLANHTLLIDRHGGEHPIDDSAAPIAADGGPAVGVVMVFHDVSERRRLQRQIARQLAELEEADRRKDEFLAMLGHELRNPLSAIANAMAVRRMLAPDDPAHQRAGVIMERQLRMMQRLVDDLLDVARIRRGAIDVRREPLDLRVAVERAVETMRPRFVEHRLTAVVTQSREPLRIEGDGVRIEQVVVNLLSNALKFTPEGGAVEITTAAEGDEAVLTVRDTGVGIEPTLLPRIFELFVQGPLPLHRPEGGLGIGLTLVRAVVQMHGGRVHASSAGAGHGSTFRVRLPRRAQPVGSAATAASRASARRAMRVLVVDDHEDSADMLAVLLGNAGHQVEIARDGPAALAAATRHRPRLVLLDIGLPGMDGYAVAAALRAMRDLEPITIVAVTGYGQAQDRERGRQAGFDLHLVKPVSPDQLGELITTLDETA